MNWMEHWEAEKETVKKAVKNLNCPESVVETVAGAIDKSPEKEAEILSKIKSCKTSKEAVKAVQMYLR